MWTMLALLAGQLVCFSFAVGYVLSQYAPDGSPSCKYKSLLFGGIGFLLFGLNGIIAAPYVVQFEFTRWVSIGLYLLGAALLQYGLSVRKQFLLNRTNSPN